jgi:protein-L-isoaspartate O-methyltransferase
MTTLLESYDEHPLTARAILERVRRGGGGPKTELDLALDPDTDITDQNHIGGLAAVIELAEAARITRGTHVCDIGGGLGGPARCLALLFGATVELVDISEARCEDARTLNALVGLADRVTVRCIDATAADVAPRTFDVLWGQSAWIQFDDLGSTLRRWMPALQAGGRIAFEDAFTRRASTDDERALIRELEAIWHCRLRAADVWRSELTRAGAEVDLFEDVSCLTGRHFARLLRSGQRPTDLERRGWELALQLADAGVLGYGRWIGRARA